LKADVKRAATEPKYRVFGECVFERGELVGGKAKHCVTAKL